MINSYSAVYMLIINVCTVSLDLRSLLRKHFSMFELSTVFICTWQSNFSLMIACIVSGSLLHVNIMYVCGVWGIFVLNNSVSSVLHPLICLAHWENCYGCGEWCYFAANRSESDKR